MQNTFTYKPRTPRAKKLKNFRSVITHIIVIHMYVYVDCEIHFALENEDSDSNKEGICGIWLEEARYVVGHYILYHLLSINF